MSDGNANPNDPNMQWDGSRWLRWNGSAWTDAATGFPVAGAAIAPPAKKGKGCLIAVLVAVALFAVLVVIIIIAVASGGGSTPKPPNATCQGKTYPDQQPDDVCADAAGTVNMGDVSVTATAPKLTKGSLGRKAQCSNVTVKNTSKESQNFNILNFKIQTPAGIVDTTSAWNMDSTLGSGTLVTGGTKTGLVCAGDSAEKGEYVFIYDPNPFTNERGIWLFKL